MANGLDKQNLSQIPEFLDKFKNKILNDEPMTKENFDTLYKTEPDPKLFRDDLYARSPRMGGLNSRYLMEKLYDIGCEAKVMCESFGHPLYWKMIREESSERINIHIGVKDHKDIYSIHSSNTSIRQTRQHILDRLYNWLRDQPRTNYDFEARAKSQKAKKEKHVMPKEVKEIVSNALGEFDPDKTKLLTGDKEKS